LPPHARGPIICAWGGADLLHRRRGGQRAPYHHPRDAGRGKSRPADGEGIADTAAYTVTFGYDPNDQPITASLPNTVTSAAGFDGNQRLITTTLQGPLGVSAPLTSSYSYAYNPTDWTTAITSVLNAVTTTQLITHDLQGRVITATDSGGNSQSWAYDGNGNLLKSITNTQTTVFSYTASITPNELLTQTILGSSPITSVFGYDLNGDTTSVTRTLGTTTSVLYDSLARPVTITAVTPSTTTSVFLRYNAQGQRAAYSAYAGSTLSYAAQFLYRGSELGQAVVISGSTSYTDTYLYDGNGNPLELIRQTKGGSSLSTARYWYGLDGRGNVVALVDSTGNVVDRYSYDLWGKLTSSSESVSQRLRYARYWYDAELN
jgi:YD repeat-containing protein